MVVEIFGVVKLLPVVWKVPEPSYQFTVPALAVAPNVTVPASHMPAGVVPVIVGVVFTVATIVVLLAVVQPLSVASK